MQSHYPDVKVIQTSQGAQGSVWLSPTGNPVAPLGSADSLRELLDLVARHPGHKGIHPRLKPGFLRSG